MAKNTLKTFHFNPQDWLSDPNVATMTPAQRGGYIQLLSYMWLDENCELNADEDYLMRLSGIPIEDLRVVQGCFKGGSSVVPTITHKRLLEELERQRNWIEKSRLGGKKSASQRIGTKQFKGGSRVVQPKGNQRATNNNIYINNNSSEELRSSSSLLLTYKYMCDLFFEALSAWFPEAKANTESKAWLDPFRLMVERDGYTEDQVVSLIRYVHGGEHKGKRYTPHHFWAKTILSPSGLRKHAQKLVAEIRAKKENPAPRPASSKIVFTSGNL